MNVSPLRRIIPITVVLIASTFCQAQDGRDTDSQPIGSGISNQPIPSEYIAPPERSLDPKQPTKTEQAVAPEKSTSPAPLDTPLVVPIVAPPVTPPIAPPVAPDIDPTLDEKISQLEFFLIESDAAEYRENEVACDDMFALLDDIGLAEKVDLPERPALIEQPTLPEQTDLPDLSNAISAVDEARPLLGPRLHKLGPITGDFVYTSQLFNNSRGGISTNGATRYRGNLDLTIRLDTEAANWWRGGTFMVYMQQSHGRTLSKNFVGDAQFFNNFDTSPRRQDLTQLGEYWYQQRFAEDAMSVKIGRQDANADFAYAELGGDFINSSFLTLANIPMPTWPFQSVGVSSLFQVNDRLRLGGGAYDHGHDLGQWWATTTSRGMFYIGQADYQPLADIADAKLTMVRIGSWYTTSDTLAVDGSSNFDNNYGFYTTIDRMLFAESTDAEQGLGTFLQYAWAPQDRNRIDVTYGGGLVYRGLVPNRDTDTLGTGFTVVEFSSDLRPLTGQTSENAVELFYKARVNRWLSVQPDMQYIVRPSGKQRDALIVGLQVEVIL